MGFFKRIFGGAVNDLNKSIEESKIEQHDESVFKSSTSSTSSKPRRNSGKKTNAKQVKKEEGAVKQPKDTSKAKRTEQPKETVVEQPPKFLINSKTKVKGPISAPSFESKVEETESQSTSDDGVFSARLEALISSALQDGVLTEQEKAILKKRVEKEGEDWDEVEMIVNARLAEMQTTSLPKDRKSVARVVVKVERHQTTEEVKENVAPDEGVENQKKVTLVYCKNCVEIYRKILIKFFWPELTTSDILDNLEKIDIYGKSYTIDNVSSEIADSLLTEIEEAGGKAHFGDPTPEEMEMPVMVYKKRPEDKDKQFLEIPEGVVEIDESACFEFNMEEVKFPSTLKKIGGCAFYNCVALENIVIPENVEYIEDSAFRCSSNLRNVTILSKQLKKIGDSAFGGCKKMKTISFPNGMEKVIIGDGALSRDVKVFLPVSMKIVKGFDRGNIIYCFSPSLEDLEELCSIYESESRQTSLYVLPEYVENYKSQAIAEGIASKIKILPMPDEYLYFYDN